MDPIVGLAVSKYKRVEYLREQLAREEDRLHQWVGQLTPDQFAAYAEATTELDRKRDERAAATQ